MGPCLYLCKLTMWLSFPGVSWLPCLLYKVMGLLNTIESVNEFLSAEGVTLKGHWIFSLFSTYVSWESLLRKASLFNSIWGHNKAVGWGIGLAVAAQGLPAVLGLLFLEFQTSTALQTDLYMHIFHLVSQLHLLTQLTVDHLKKMFILCSLQEAMNFFSGKQKLNSWILSVLITLFSSLRTIQQN